MEPRKCANCDCSFIPREEKHDVCPACFQKQVDFQASFRKKAKKRWGQDMQQVRQEKRTDDFLSGRKFNKSF